MDDLSLPYRISISELEDLLGPFPPKPRYFGGNTVVSPMNLVQRERMLRKLKTELELSEPVPTDVLVIGYDEPEDRDVTKIGGVPYWPCNKAWPKDDKGCPMEFLAQINFCGSRDILPNVPADLLSIFVASDWCSILKYHFEWQFIDHATELITGSSLPEIKYPQVKTPAFAVNCRVNDYGKATPISNSVSFDGWEDLVRIRGSKIGGIPRFFYDSLPSVTGDYLCSIHSLRHPTDVPWPFINVKDPLTPEILGGIGCNGGRGCHDTVMFNQEGTLFLFLEKDGTVNAEIQSW